MTRYWTFTLDLAILSAVLLGGCGGGSGKKAATPAAESPGKGTSAVKVSRDNPCSVMFPSEVQEILGLPSEMREVVDEVTCHYHFPPASGSPTASAGDETFIEVKVPWTDGRMAVAATRMAGKLLGGGGSSGFEKVDGHRG